MGYEEHREQAGREGGRSVAFAVVTCSDTRTEETDVSGGKIRALLEEGGQEVVHYEIVADEPAAIRAVLKNLARRADVQAIVLNGGTGISRRDNTFDVVSELLTKTLPGFGELFRMLSYESIGSGAMLSRATAGIMVTHGAYGHEQHVVVFCVPGAPAAVELAMVKLILPEAGHLVWETRR